MRFRIRTVQRRNGEWQVFFQLANTSSSDALLLLLLFYCFFPHEHSELMLIFGKGEDAYLHLDAKKRRHISAWKNMASWSKIREKLDV